MPGVTVAADHPDFCGVLSRPRGVYSQVTISPHAHSHVTVFR